MSRFVTAVVAAALLGLPLGAILPAQAQDRESTLADIRQELSVLYFEVQGLNRELSTTDGAPTGSGGGSMLERVDAIEAEIARLNAKTERLEFRIEQIVRDGTNRIGDLEFRLVELEGGDVSALGDTPTLGGEPATRLPEPGRPADAQDDADAPQLAASERADFDRAREALEAGEYQSAAEQFATFIQTYHGGPLTSEAHFLRAKAHEGMDDTAQAARAYLDAFTDAPDGQRAPEALLRLGRALNQLGQVNEACVMFDELIMRFPASEIVPQALSDMQELGCD